MLDINWHHLESLTQLSFWERIRGHRGVQNERIRIGSENAMGALNTTQQSALDHIRSKYPRNAQTALNNLNRFLLQSTPLSQNYVGLSEEEKRRYYQDIFHTAYRCLICPPLRNHLISPHAAHTKMDSLGRPQATNFSEEQRETIAAIWQALNDEDFPLAEGYTRDRAKALFVETLSDIGRAHNRDNAVDRDDMMADKPSCQQGINQRLVQFIMIALREDPSQRVLNADLMKQKFQEHFIGTSEDGRRTVFDKIEQLDLNALTQMNEALDNLVLMLENTPGESQLLNQLFPWTTDDLAAFIEECKDYYGRDRFVMKLDNPVYFQDKRFDNFGGLILALAREPLNIYYQDIKNKIQNRIEQLPQESAESQEDTEIEQLRERLIQAAIEEHEEALLYQLLDGTPEFVRQTAQEKRDREARLIEEERERQISFAIVEGNETLIYQLLDGSPDFIKQCAEARQAQQNTVENLERMREELVNMALAQGSANDCIEALLDGTAAFIVNYAAARQTRVRYEPPVVHRPEEDTAAIRQPRYRQEIAV